MSYDFCIAPKNGINEQADGYDALMERGYLDNWMKSLIPEDTVPHRKGGFSIGSVEVSPIRDAEKTVSLGGFSIYDDETHREINVTVYPNKESAKKLTYRNHHTTAWRISKPGVGEVINGFLNGLINRKIKRPDKEPVVTPISDLSDWKMSPLDVWY